MKTVNGNINFNFDLSKGGDQQITNLDYILNQLKNAGYEINLTASVQKSGLNSTERVNRDIGPNEAALLERSGKSRMRCPSGETDREGFAARLLQERYGVKVEDFAPLPTVACDTDDSEDDSDLI